MFGDDEKDYREIYTKDCPDCQGTGIGYSHEPRSCGRCRGLGFLMVRCEIEEE